MADKVIVSKAKLTAIGNAIRSKTGKTDTLTLDTMTTEIANIETGIIPTGTLEITTTEEVDVGAYKTAKVVDSNLTEENIKKDVNILGITGTYEGESGSGSGSGEDRFKKFLNATKKSYYLFYGYSGTSVDDLIKYEDTENVTDMNNMFGSCKSLQTIPQLDTGNVTKMYSMFNNCVQLQTTPQLDTSNVTDMDSMFYNCYKLQTIDITSMDKITSTTGSKNFASNCKSLTKFIIRNMTKIPSLNSNAFINCHHFEGTVDSTYNPEGLKDGRIYVPDNMVESLKTATNWSAYADCIVPLSTLSE